MLLLTGWWLFWKNTHFNVSHLLSLFLATMKITVLFIVALCILSAAISTVTSQRFRDRLDETICRRTCRMFSRAHRQGCCQLYNSCCTTWKVKKKKKKSKNILRYAKMTHRIMLRFLQKWWLSIFCWNWTVLRADL